LPHIAPKREAHSCQSRRARGGPSWKCPVAGIHKDAPRLYSPRRRHEFRGGLPPIQTL
jgi:hypothetical protein